MSRREQIRMTDEECRRFLASQKVVCLSTIGGDGYPHVTPLSFLLLDRADLMLDVREVAEGAHLERNSRAAALFESSTDYAELRGAMFKVEARLHRDHDTLARFVEALVERYTALGAQAPDLALFRAQIPHRVGLELIERSRVTWDHGQLAGAC